ncbi:hypothetical protein ACLB1R_00975 [Escherichia coli]
MTHSKHLRESLKKILAIPRYKTQIYDWSICQLNKNKKDSISLHTPQICCIDSELFQGIEIHYTEETPFFNPASDYKWNIIDSLLSNNKYIYISHKVSSEKCGKPEVNAVIWMHEGSFFSTHRIKKGFFAYFSFRGSKDNYWKYMHNVHIWSLPFYGLQRGYGYDIEKITKYSENDFLFEFYVPVRNCGIIG